MHGLGLSQSLSEEEHQLLDELEDELAQRDASRDAEHREREAPRPAPRGAVDELRVHRLQASEQWQPSPAVLRLFEKLAALLLEDLRAASTLLVTIEKTAAHHDGPSDPGSAAVHPAPHADAERPVHGTLSVVAAAPDLAAASHDDAQDPTSELRERLTAIQAEGAGEFDLYALRARPTSLTVLPTAHRLPPRATAELRSAKPLQYRSVRALLAMWLEAPQGGALSTYLATAPEDSPSDRLDSLDPMDGGSNNLPASIQDALWLAWLRAAQLGPVHAALLAEQLAAADAHRIPALPPTSRSLRAFSLACRRRFAVEQRARALAVDAVEHLDLARRICRNPQLSALDCVRAFEERIADEAASRAEARRLRRFGLQRAVLFVLLLGFSLYMLVFR